MKEPKVSSCYDPLTLIRVESNECWQGRLDLPGERGESHVRALAWLFVVTLGLVAVAAGLRALP